MARSYAPASHSVPLTVLNAPGRVVAAGLRLPGGAQGVLQAATHSTALPATRRILGCMSVFDSGRREVRATRGVLVGSYSNYADAQQAVDRLSDASFPVEHVQIVGRDLMIVEDVTGRLTKARAALVGAGSGAWFGLFIGLLVGLFTTGPEWLGLVLGGVLIGAFWGAVFGVLRALGHARDARLRFGARAGRGVVRRARRRRARGASARALA